MKFDPTLRYAKQIKAYSIGSTGQDKLATASCAVIGMGALGSAIADLLVRAGIGYLRIIDRDFVEISNLHRQSLYNEQDTEKFMPKAIAAAHALRRVNSSITIDPIIADVHAGNIEQLLDGIDFIVDGSDNFTIRYLINDYSVSYNKPSVYGAVVGTSGSTATFIPQHTPCFRCLFPEPPELGAVDTCDTAGVLGPIVHMIASIQAAEIMKLATGQQKQCNSALLQLDCWSLQQLSLDISHAKNEQCPCCSQGSRDWLNEASLIHSTSICGRQTIQLTLAEPLPYTLDEFAALYEKTYETKRNRYLVKIKYSDQINLILFPDHRIMIQGTEDVEFAVNILKKFVEI